jgi:hypothetical protein
MAKKSSGLAVVVSVLLLMGLFVVGVKLVTERVEIKTVNAETGTLEFIPTMSSTEDGTVSMGLRYIPIRQNVNVFEYIYEHDDIALSDSDHTELFKLGLSNESDSTRIYKVEKIINGTFLRVLSTSANWVKNLTTPSNVAYENTEKEYHVEVKTDSGNVYLYMSKMGAS